MCSKHGFLTNLYVQNLSIILMELVENITLKMEVVRERKMFKMYFASLLYVQIV